MKYLMILFILFFNIYNSFSKLNGLNKMYKMYMFNNIFRNNNLHKNNNSTTSSREKDIQVLNVVNIYQVFDTINDDKIKNFSIYDDILFETQYLSNQPVLLYKEYIKLFYYIINYFNFHVNDEFN
jgi:hypothetical protein